MIDPLSTSIDGVNLNASPEVANIEAWLQSLTAAQNSTADARPVSSTGSVSSTAVISADAVSGASRLAANSLLGVIPPSAYVAGVALGNKAGPFEGFAAYYLVPPNGDVGNGTWMVSSPQVAAGTAPIIASIIKRVTGIDIPADWVKNLAIGGLPLKLSFVVSFKGAALSRVIETGSINSIGPGDVEFGVGGVVPLGVPGANAGAMFVNARIDMAAFPDTVNKLLNGTYNGTFSVNAGVLLNVQAAAAALLFWLPPAAGGIMKTQQIANSFMGMAWRYSLNVRNGDWSLTTPDGTVLRNPITDMQNATRPASTSPTGSPYYFILPTLNFGNPVLARNNIVLHLTWGASIWSIANSTEGKNFGVGAVEVANRFLAFGRERNTLAPYVVGQPFRLQNNQMRRIILSELASADTPEKKQQIVNSLANRYGIDFGIPQLRQANARLMATANANGVPSGYTFTRQVFQGNYARSAGNILAGIDNGTVVAAADRGIAVANNGTVVASSDLSALDIGSTNTTNNGVGDLVEVLIEDPTIDDPTSPPWDTLVGDAILDAVSNAQLPGENVNDPETALDHLGRISFETALPIAEKATITAAVTAAFSGSSPPTPQKFAELLEDMRSQYTAGSPEDIVMEEAIAAAAIAATTGLAGYSKINLDRAIKQLADTGEPLLTANQKDVFRVEFRNLMRNEATLTQPAFDEALRRAKEAPTSSAPPFEPLPPGAPLPPADPSRGEYTTRSWGRTAAENNYYYKSGQYGADPGVPGLRPLGADEVYVSNTREYYYERQYADGSVERWTTRTTDISIRIVGTSQFNQYLDYAPGPDNLTLITTILRTL